MTPSLKELKELAENATPRSPIVRYGEKLDWGRLNTVKVSGAVKEFSTIAAFIAAANPATILKLIDALEIQREALEKESAINEEPCNACGETIISHNYAKEALEKTKELFI